MLFRVSHIPFTQWQLFVFCHLSLGRLPAAPEDGIEQIRAVCAGVQSCAAPTHLPRSTSSPAAAKPAPRAKDCGMGFARIKNDFCGQKALGEQKGRIGTWNLITPPSSLSFPWSDLIWWSNGGNKCQSSSHPRNNWVHVKWWIQSSM